MRKNKAFYVLDKWYTLTICPQDRYQYFLEPNRFTKCYNHIKSYFATISPKTEYVGCVETSEPYGSVKSTGPRVHFHGQIQFKGRGSLLQFLLVIMPLMLKTAIIEVDTMKDPEIWKQYCTKQQWLYAIINDPISNNIILLEDWRRAGVPPSPEDPSPEEPIEDIEKKEIIINNDWVDNLWRKEP